MRTIFIGCGVLVLLALGGLGFLTWKIYPVVREFEQSTRETLTRIREVERQNPFEAEGQSRLDTERFVTSLEMRRRLGEELAEQIRHLQGVEERLETEGGFDLATLVGGMLGSFGRALEALADQLEQAGMGWPEFAWHTRVLWGTLHRLDVLGLGDDTLAPLRGEYLRFRDGYAKLAERHPEMPALRDLVEGLPPVVLTAAEQALATDVVRAKAALATTELDHLYMSPVDSIQALGNAGLKPFEPAQAHKPR